MSMLNPMRLRIFVSLLCLLLLFFAGCKKPASVQPSSNSQSTSGHESGSTESFNACGLLEKKEIEAIQGSPIKETKSSAGSDGGFRVSQCFYTAEEFSKSVSLAVTQSDTVSPRKRSPRKFWKETFGRYAGDEKERERNQEEKENLGDQARQEEREESLPPKKIDGIGDEAYWTAGRMGGALYILKDDTFIRISVGGQDKEETKIDKSKALAEKALRRL
jgi:hypothetical protein